MQCQALPRRRTLAHNRLVPGSNPGGPTGFSECPRGVRAAGARPDRAVGLGWYQIGTKTFTIRGCSCLLKRRRRAFGGLVQSNPHVVDLEMAVGLRGEPRISVAHDALDNGVRDLRLQQQGGGRVTQPIALDQSASSTSRERTSPWERAGT